MAELKTKPTGASVASYLQSIEEPARRADCLALAEMMQTLTGEPATLWGESMVGFGHYHYRYASGNEGDWFLAGFASRKSALSIYVMAGFEQCQSLLARLGKHKASKSCLYIKRLADIDQTVLAQILELSVAQIRQRHP